MGDNSELGLSGIFCGVLLIAGREHLQNIEDSSSVGLMIGLLFCIRATKVKFFTPLYFIYLSVTSCIIPNFYEKTKTFTHLPGISLDILAHCPFNLKYSFQ